VFVTLGFAVLVVRNESVPPDQILWGVLEMSQGEIVQEEVYVITKQEVVIVSGDILVKGVSIG
jgi:hypothetical protein